MRNLGVCVVLFVVFGIFAAIFTHVGPTVEPGAETTGPALPSYFEVQETGGWNTNMSVVAGGQELGQINEKANGNLMTFEYRDTANKLIASAQANNGTWVDTIDVWTNTGRKIGTIKEDLSQRSWGSTVYTIEDASGNEIATSKKTGGFISQTKFQLSDEAGSPLLMVERTGQSPRDVWSVSVQGRNLVDPRVLVMIAAFKTGHDNKSD